MTVKLAYCLSDFEPYMPDAAYGDSDQDNEPDPKWDGMRLKQHRGCVLKAMREGVGEGYRNTFFFAIGVGGRLIGQSFAKTMQEAEAFNAKCDPPEENEREIRSTVKSGFYGAYRAGFCEKVAPFCSPPCPILGEYEPSRPSGNGHHTQAPHATAYSLQDVIDVYQKWLYLPDPSPLEVVLGAVAANRRPGDPVWLLLISPPGGGKTELVTPLAALHDVHLVATLTEAALLSGVPKKQVAQGAHGGLLRLIGQQGILIPKDFTSVLAMNRESRGPLLAALREIYDGSWTRHLGTDGGKTLEWQGKCGLIGCTTGALDSYHGVIASLGERFCLYRLSEDGRNDRTRSALSHFGQEQNMRVELANAVAGFFATVDVAEDVTLTKTEVEYLIVLADLAVQARSAVERDSYSSSKEIINVPGAEVPTRLAKVLAQLLCGLVVIGVERQRAWELVRKVALDSMPAIRRKAFDFIAIQQGQLTTSQIATAINLPSNTVRRTLEDLAAYNLIERESRGEGKADFWQLSEWASSAYGAVVTLPQTSVGMKSENTPLLIHQYTSTDFCGKPVGLNDADADKRVFE